jgi:hypothetical protein
MIKKFTFSLIVLTIFGLQTVLVTAQELVPVDIEDMQSEGFTITPAQPNSINPRKFIFELKPGTEIKEDVIVNNLSDQEATFLLYGSDPTLSAQGTPAYKTRQTNGNGEGTWIKFDEPKITLGPREQKVTNFTLSIPLDTELGDYRAGITMEKIKENTEGQNIVIATRIILHSDIKVTDNPGVILKDKPIETTTPASTPIKNISWQVYYFWSSLTLFGIFFIAFLWVTFHEKKNKRTKLKKVSTKTKEKTKFKPKSRVKAKPRTKKRTRKKSTKK